MMIKVRAPINMRILINCEVEIPKIKPLIRSPRKNSSENRITAYDMK